MSSHLKWSIHASWTLSSMDRNLCLQNDGNKEFQDLTSSSFSLMTVVSSHSRLIQIDRCFSLLRIGCLLGCFRPWSLVLGCGRCSCLLQIWRGFLACRCWLGSVGGLMRCHSLCQDHCRCFPCFSCEHHPAARISSTVIHFDFTHQT